MTQIKVKLLAELRFHVWVHLHNISTPGSPVEESEAHVGFRLGNSSLPDTREGLWVFNFLTVHSRSASFLSSYIYSVTHSWLISSVRSSSLPLTVWHLPNPATSTCENKTPWTNSTWSKVFNKLLIHKMDTNDTNNSWGKPIVFK